MNNKSGIFTRGFDIRENTAVKIKIDLTVKKRNILYLIDPCKGFWWQDLEC